MESSARASKQASGRSTWPWWLLSGLVLGILGTIFVPDLVRPYLPEMMRGENVEVAGIVEAKSREADRLLLTIAGSSGAVLVTYTHQIPEMDLLIEPGDSVILAVREYAPFIEDPSVRRVQKGGSTIQRRAQPAEAEQGNQNSAIERRPKESPVTVTQTLDEDMKENFTREIGPTDSLPEAEESGIDSATAPAEEDRAPEEQQEPQE